MLLGTFTRGKGRNGEQRRLKGFFSGRLNLVGRSVGGYRMSSRFLISFSRIFHFGARLFVFVFFYPEVGRWSILVFILFLLFTRCRFYLLIVLGAPSHPTELADDLPLLPTLVINCLRQITRCWASIRGRIAAGRLRHGRRLLIA